MKGNAKEYLLLAGILLIGSLVRFWGIGFGLPHTGCRPDESNIIETALRFGSGDLNPHYFTYPTLYLYLLFGIYGLYYFVGLISGRYDSPTDLVAEYLSNPSVFYLLDRIFVALLGILTILILYRVAVRLFDKKIAMLSAFFLSLSYLHVRDSHFGLLDVPVTFALLAASLLILRCYEKRTIRDYIIAGMAAGLAASIKWIGVVLLVPIILTHLFVVAESPGKKLSAFLDKRLLLALASFVLVILIGTPFMLLDFHGFWESFSFQMGLVGGAQETPAGRALMEFIQTGGANSLDSGWWYHLKLTLWHGLGWSLLAAALLGLPLIFKRNFKQAAIVLAFPAIYYLIAGSSHLVYLRYMVPLIPFLCLCAALFIAALTHVARLILRIRSADILAGLLAILVILPSASNILKFDALLAKEDNRLIAARWIRQKLPAGASIYETGDWWWDQVLPEPRLQISSREAVSIYDLWHFEADAGKFVVNGSLTEELPQYLIKKSSPLIFTRIPGGIEELLARDYKLQKAFMAADLEGSTNIYDPLDAFFVPYAGFAGVRRPGPNVEVWERKE